jgi:hypothetical protein
MADEPKTHGWWQTLPGILTTVVGIITGLTGLIVALQQAGVFQKKIEPANVTQDLCRELNGFSIQLDINRYPGLLGPTGIVLQQTGDGGFRFETTLEFNEETNRQFSTEISDPIVGTCKGNSLVFTRKLRDRKPQYYHGELSKTVGVISIINGSFTDADIRDYKWFGHVVQPTQN